MRYLVFPLVGVMFSVGCKNPEVTQLSPGVFILAKSDRKGMFGNFSTFKMKVIQEANEFAAARGKVAIPVSTRETPIAPGRLATFEYQFRLVDKDSPEAKGVNVLGPTPTISIQKIETKDSTERPKDVYGELIRLDDLKKKGIITDTEFQDQKKKLLEGK